jgi:hypothetical protein
MLPNQLTFGVEIECYSPMRLDELARRISAAGVHADYVPYGTHVTSRDWKVVNDASLSRYNPTGFYGGEVVSPILQGEAGLATLAKVADIVLGLNCKITQRCGLHVHIGARNATPEQLRSLAKMFLKYEAHFDALVPNSRRLSNNFYCRSNIPGVGGSPANGGSMSTATFAKIDATRTNEQLARVMNGGWSTEQYNEYRYHKLNFQSMATHGTVEFRQHSGSVESKKICAWVKLVSGFVACAMSVRTVSETPATFASLLTKTDRATAAYLESRRVALAGSV